MTMPMQKPGRSKQDYSTPADFMRAAVMRFGAFSWDLAASAENAKAPNWIGVERDSLTVEWHKLDGLLWLNPPFSHCYKFAEKCKDEMLKGARIVLLTPASVSSDWFNSHTKDYAHSIAVRPRLVFEGESDPYPKDLMLSVYAYGLTGFSTWRWK